MYVYAGAYQGDTVPLVQIVEEQFLKDVERVGQWSTHDRSAEVEALFKPLLSKEFVGPWRYCMVNVLFPMAVLHPHMDSKLPEGVIRKHLVLQSNEYAWCYHGSSWKRLIEGYMYTLDPSQLHYSVNLGTTPRIHLLVDLETI